MYHLYQVICILIVLYSNTFLNTLFLKNYFEILVECKYPPPHLILRTRVYSNQKHVPERRGQQELIAAVSAAVKRALHKILQFERFNSHNHNGGALNPRHS